MITGRQTDCHVICDEETHLSPSLAVGDTTVVSHLEELYSATSSEGS